MRLRISSYNGLSLTTSIRTAGLFHNATSYSVIIYHYPMDMPSAAGLFRGNCVENCSRESPGAIDRRLTTDPRVVNRFSQPRACPTEFLGVGDFSRTPRTGRVFFFSRAIAAQFAVTSRQKKKKEKKQTMGVCQTNVRRRLCPRIIPR